MEAKIQKRIGEAAKKSWNDYRWESEHNMPEVTYTDGYKAGRREGENEILKLVAEMASPELANEIAETLNL